MNQKPDTPMKLLSSHLRTMASMVDGMDSEPSVALNGHEPKGVRFYAGAHAFGRKKGVDNDHVRIYKIDDNLSIAFAFNYILVSPATVTVTRMEGQNYSSSRNFSKDEFRMLMNNLNKQLYFIVNNSTSQNAKKTPAKVDKKTFDALFVACFLSGENNISSLDLDGEIEQATKYAETLWREMDDVIGAKMNLHKEKVSEAEKLKRKVSRLVSASPDGRRLAEIQTQINALRLESNGLTVKIEEMSKTLYDEHGVAGLYEAANQIWKEADQVRLDTLSKIENNMSQLPAHAKKKIRDMLR